ncbi:hypothetical protein L1987_61359 [Smallanthus sonchifolius]|uniref:Uncharacterized protein n=1 Tax=Smallanthus sonchifolius TaxID=185202 RepID=A0ACB9DAH7_9ASTR|nr:hypothetical protein L1987_61359 [Smallanthus sonchifolius]
MCPTLSPSADLRSAFDILDVDRDGKISHGDLKIFYADAGDETIGTMMTVADLNKDGYVEYDEFEKVVRSNSSGVMEDLFHEMDRDRDGKVGHGDLKSYLSSAGIQVNDDDIKAMVRLGGGEDAELCVQSCFLSSAYVWPSSSTMLSGRDLDINLVELGNDTVKEDDRGVLLEGEKPYFI